MKATLLKLFFCMLVPLALSPLASADAQTAASPTEARAITKEAYMYGYPMVDGYRVQYTYFNDRQNPEYKGPRNQVHSTARVYTPADTAIVGPNSDTPYSTVPKIEPDRYFSIQLIDAYTFNFDYIGSRTTGNDGGSFLVAGPNWTGETPKGIKKVFRSNTYLALAAYRTQLFNPGDIENVKTVQAGYKVQPLSEFLGQAAPKPAPAIEYIKPLTPETQKTSTEFFNILNFILQFCPTDPSETELMARFAKIGIGAGKHLDTAKLSPEIKTAIEQGMADAWAEFAVFKKTKFDTGQVTFGDVFGTRQFLKNNYLYRFAAGAIGLYGNSKEEAMYPYYGIDSDKQPLTGSKRYTLRFAPGQLPPVNAFWSVTMYELPRSQLYANPLDRYLINSSMLPQLKRDPDGGLTLVIQNESPGKEWEANWLPAPKNAFVMAMRLYWPKTEAVDGTWTAPSLISLK
jgi:hypothetical protein